MLDFQILEVKRGVIKTIWINISILDAKDQDRTENSHAELMATYKHYLIGLSMTISIGGHCQTFIPKAG